MYKKTKFEKTTISVNEGYVGVTLEERVRKMESAKEPITDGAPLIYTERKDGVESGYNIRTDRWEIAVEAMDKVSKDREAKRALAGMEREKKSETVKTDIVRNESKQGTESGKAE